MARLKERYNASLKVADDMGILSPLVHVGQFKVCYKKKSSYKIHISTLAIYINAECIYSFFYGLI